MGLRQSLRLERVPPGRSRQEAARVAACNSALRQAWAYRVWQRAAGVVCVNLDVSGVQRLTAMSPPTQCSVAGDWHVAGCLAARATSALRLSPRFQQPEPHPRSQLCLGIKHAPPVARVDPPAPRLCLAQVATIVRIRLSPRAAPHVYKGPGAEAHTLIGKPQVSFHEATL